MSRINSFVIMHQDLNPKEDTPPMGQLIRDYWHVTGDRAGLTDEQLQEVGDE